MLKETGLLVIGENRIVSYWILLGKTGLLDVGENGIVRFWRKGTVSCWRKQDC